MKRISYLETCHPRNLLSRVYVFVLRLDSRLRGNDSVAVSLHASRFTRYAYFIVFLFSLHASLFTLHAQAKLENGMEADIVIGQPRFDTDIDAVSKRNLDRVSGLHADGKRLFIVDGDGNRIVIMNQLPTKNFAAFDLVLGQPNFDSNTCNNGGVSASSLCVPQAAYFYAGKLFVADLINSRVLLFNNVPSINFASADVVIGQPNMASNTQNNGGISAQTLNLPVGVCVYENRVMIGDRTNHRVLIYNSIPTTNFQPADVVLGQPDFLSNTVNNGGLSARTFNTPQSLSCESGTLLVTDTNNNRVLIYHEIPVQNNTPADVVIGQPNFSSNSAGSKATQLIGPSGVFYDGQQLFVSDHGNGRVLIYKELPKRNGAAADFVIGQKTLSTGVRALGRDRLFGPVGIVKVGSRLIVNDFNNRRTLIYNLGDNSNIDLGPQFSQGKAVVGKVFFDWNGNGKQDAGGIS